MLVSLIDVVIIYSNTIHVTQLATEHNNVVCLEREGHGKMEVIISGLLVSWKTYPEQINRTIFYQFTELWIMFPL